MIARLPVDAFASLAQQYIALVDEIEEVSPHAFLLACAHVLPRLYAAGLDLPEVEPNSSTVTESDTSLFPSLFGKIANRLGQKYSVYFRVYDPVFDADAGMGYLPEDLADIYVDLIGPLSAYESGDFNEAIWCWRFAITGHAGDHLVDALRVIHRLVNDHMPHDFFAQPSSEP